jgi:hypothetical protein
VQRGVFRRDSVEINRPTFLAGGARAQLLNRIKSTTYCSCCAGVARDRGKWAGEGASGAARGRVPGKEMLAVPLLCHDCNKVKLELGFLVLQRALEPARTAKSTFQRIMAPPNHIPMPPHGAPRSPAHQKRHRAAQPRCLRGPERGWPGRATFPSFARAGRTRIPLDPAGPSSESARVSPTYAVFLNPG